MAPKPLDVKGIAGDLINAEPLMVGFNAARKAGAWIEDKASDFYQAAKPYLPKELGGTDRPADQTSTTMRHGQKPAKAKMRHGS